MRRILISIVVIFSGIPCFAQWKGSQWSNILAYGVHGVNLFESTGGHVFRDTFNSGWEEADAGINFSIDPYPVTSFASLGQYVYAGQGINSNAYRSSNNGGTWSYCMPSPIATNGSVLFSAGEPFSPVDSVYVSSDSGSTWRAVLSPHAVSFMNIGTTMLAIVNGVIKRSTDNGNSWEPVSSPSSPPTCFAVIDTIIFAASPSGAEGIAYSTDSGGTWKTINFPHLVTALATDGKNLWAGTMDSGVYVSTDNGKNWRNVSEGLRYFLQVTAMAVYDTMMIVATVSPGSQNYWQAWRPIREMANPPSAVKPFVQVSDTISVYPNPASDQITIFSGGMSIYAVRVLNVLGEGVLDMPKVNESEISLDLSKLPSGTYFLQIQTSNGIVLRKVIKE